MKKESPSPKKSAGSKRIRIETSPRRPRNTLPVALSSLRDVDDVEFSVTDLAEGKTPRAFQRVAAGAITLVPRMILSDPIGSGKSVSTILGLRKLFEVGEVKLVLGVMPGSVLHQWKGEIEAWFPGVFRVEIADGLVAARHKLYQHVIDSHGHPLRHVHVILLSYSMSRQDKALLEKLPYQLVFFDEITHLKDPTTAQSKAAQVLADKAERVLGITALPVQSKFEDIHPLFNVVEPSLFVSRERFLKNFCHTWSHPIILNKGTPRQKKIWKVEVTGYKNLELFKQMVENHLLYRTEDDIGLQMPEQILLPRWLRMTAQQEAMYDEVEEGYLRLGGTVQTLQPIQQLVRLGQICDGTQLIDPDIKSSCKLIEISSLLTTELANEQVVVFSKWTEMLDAVREEIMQPLGLRFGSIVGGQTPGDREHERLRFQSGETQVLLLSTAGEEGLNLGAAKCMICCDSLYNEGRMRQVYGRIRRLSTPHPIVRVISLLCKNSIEQRIMELREKRGALIDYLDDPAGMDPTELHQLMRMINRQVSLLD